MTCDGAMFNVSVYVCICNLLFGLIKVTDPYKWRRRPLEEGMIVAAAWRVAVLRKLKQPLDDALYAPFDTLCNDYLCTIRDCDDEFEVKKQVVCILFVDQSIA